jgi:hypothetical protein
MTTPTTTTTPYSALCDVFTEIENVSGRLEIQEKLTTLFRKVLLKDGGGDGGRGSDDGENGGGKKEASSTTSTASSNSDNPTQSDLYTLLYLASNTVAPQHANVELGVGDGILIKAIGEASGTAPNMIKKKYEKEGDLGNVAMNAKGKQRTLVGFGKVTSGGPKRLSCVDVLKVFKEIVSSDGLIYLFAHVCIARLHHYNLTSFLTILQLRSGQCDRIPIPKMESRQDQISPRTCQGMRIEVHYPWIAGETSYWIGKEYSLGEFVPCGDVDETSGCGGSD